MCGLEIREGKRPHRRRWHQTCLDLWMIMSDPRAARRFVFARDKGVCARCGVQDERLGGDWDVDHGKRLADAPRDPWFWSPANLQTLCSRLCHPAKTAEENRGSRQ